MAKSGDRVAVHAPPFTSLAAPSELARLPGHFNLRALTSLHRSIGRGDRHAVVLVQYVPHMYGMKGMNLLFVLWLWLLCPRRVWVMFHEVAYPLKPNQSWPERVLAVVQRLMAMIALRAASRVFVSIPGWIPRLRRLTHPLPPVTWLPIPSNLPNGDRANAARIRERVLATGGERVVGHFGTFGGAISRLLDPVLARLLEDVSVRVLIVGRGSGDFARDFRLRHPTLAQRIHVADSLTGEQVSDHLLACDALVQPYPDGASSRRTTLMAGLALGVPVVSNLGFLSEPLWNSSGAIAVASTDPTVMAGRVVELLNSPRQRHELTAGGKRLYESRFSLDVVGTTLSDLVRREE